MYGVALEERKYWTAMDIGSAAHRAGEKALSRLAFQIVVEKAPVSPDRGYAFRQLGRLEEAIENYEHWLAVTPHWQQKSYAWLGYADALQEKAKREKTWERAVPEVLRAYQRAVHLDTGTSPTVSQRQYENFLRRYKTSSAPQSE